MRLARFPLACAFGVAPLLAAGSVLAVEPGVDIAAPRVAISTLLDSLAFSPANPVVEQGDYVRWLDAVGGSLCHTTTSGGVCGAPTGLWNVGIGPSTCLGTVPSFTRQFTDAPGPLPYFCSPHCAFGMRGQVSVTTLIDLGETLSGGVLTLSWSGGSGLYRVLQSSAPAFTTATTTALTGAGGTTGTTLTDATMPPSGGALFYLVMNQF